MSFDYTAGEPVTFEEAMKNAAKAADRAVTNTIRKYASNGVSDEPEISTYLISQLDSQFNRRPGIDGLAWSSTIVRNGSGKAAEEDMIGADILLHINVDTPTQKYSKGVLIQAKRTEPDTKISNRKLADLQDQCLKMLKHTPAAFVFNYARIGMRVGPATRFAGTLNRELHRQCTWTSYRFFLELFRCPVGDPQIPDARVKSLPMPHILYVSGKGEITAR